MPKKTKLNSRNPKYRKAETTTGPVDVFAQELICEINGVKIYATRFKETKMPN